LARGREATASSRFDGFDALVSPPDDAREGLETHRDLDRDSEGGPSGDIGAARTEDVFAESIVTASNGTQSPLDTASSTSVITEQDIRLSGIVKIPELIRRLAGVDVMEVTGGQTEASIRGFNQPLANKTLVLVDGRRSAAARPMRTRQPSPRSTDVRGRCIVGSSRTAGSVPCG
jgi:outer membrane receptor protein involved in Fe transport